MFWVASMDALPAVDEAEAGPKLGMFPTTDKGSLPSFVTVRVGAGFFLKPSLPTQ